MNEYLDKFNEFLGRYSVAAGFIRAVLLFTVLLSGSIAVSVGISILWIWCEMISVRIDNIDFSIDKLWKQNQDSKFDERPK